MARRLQLLMLLLLLPLLGHACRSTNKAEPEATAKAGDSAESDGKSAVKTSDACATKPDPAVCCEALIPSCNDCRTKNREVLEAWNAECAPKSLADNDCSTPPVASCCSDDSDECRQCRSVALNQMLAWKTKCGEDDAAACDRQPVPTACCEALTPSCDACRERNLRVKQEWRRRCG